MGRAGVLLAIDTATSIAVVALGDRDGRLLGETGWAAGFRHGEELLGRIDSLLRAWSTPVAGIGGIVVGTGPGAFTGLRVGLATAKGLALALGRPVVGVASGAGLLEAAREAGIRGPADLLLPAGPFDRILVRDADPGVPDPASAVRLGPGDDLEVHARGIVIAVDLEGRAEPAALDHGRVAQAGLGRALLRLGAARLATHGPDDLASLVPEYVTLPRGVERETGSVALGRA